MTQTDIVWLQAFLVALVQLEESLPPSLQEGINEIGQTLVADRNSALKKLKQLVRDELLWDKFDRASGDFFKRYQAKPKDKVILSSEGQSEAEGENMDIENLLPVPESILDGSIQRIQHPSDIFQGDTVDNLKKDKAEFEKKLPPAASDPNESTYLWAEHWAELLCRIA